MEIQRPWVRKMRGFFMSTNPPDERVTSLPSTVRPKATCSQGDFYIHGGAL